MYQRNSDWGGHLALHESTNSIVTALERRTPYLMAQDFVESIVATNRHDQTIRHLRALIDDQQWANQQQAVGLAKIVASQHMLGEALESGFGIAARKLDTLNGSISKLQASFDWWMGESLWKLEAQSETLKALLDTLQAPLDTQARELHRRATFAYQQGWYSEALGDFLESERKNYQDFSCHQAIGNIYLYHQDPPNYSAARDAYLKAGRYATPHSAYHAALGYMYAGFASYMLRDDAKAVEYAERAVTLDNNLAEAWFNLAKYAAVAMKADVVFKALQRAIQLDRNYAIRVCFDDDFTKVEHVRTSVIKALTSTAKQHAEGLLGSINATLSVHEIPKKHRAQIATDMATAAKLVSEGTLFSLEDAMAPLTKVRRIVDGLRLPELDKEKNRLINLIGTLFENAIPLKGGIFQFEGVASALQKGYDYYRMRLEEVKVAVQEGSWEDLGPAEASLKQIASELDKEIRYQSYRSASLQYEREREELKKRLSAMFKERQQLTAARSADLELWKAQTSGFGTCDLCGKKRSVFDKAAARKFTATKGFPDKPPLNPCAECVEYWNAKSNSDKARELRTKLKERQIKNASRPWAWDDNALDRLDARWSELSAEDRKLDVKISELKKKYGIVWPD